MNALDRITDGYFLWGWAVLPIGHAALAVDLSWQFTKQPENRVKNAVRIGTVLHFLFAGFFFAVKYSRL